MRSILLTAALVGVLAWTGPASAQVIVPGGQAPKIDELQKKIEEAFQRAAALQGQAGTRKTHLRWGGLHLEKPSAELAAQLGLEEKEGLVVTAIDRNALGDKAGVKPNDVLIKVGKDAVPSDPAAFAKLLKDQKNNGPVDLVVIRKGKEEKIAAVKMPPYTQNVAGGGAGLGGFGGLPGIGGIGGAGGLPGNPFMQGKLTKLHMEMDVNGGKLVKDQDGDKFSGEFTKDELKISVKGTLENGLPRIGEITVQEGKESKKYTSPRDLPAQHRPIVQQLLPSPFTGMMMMPLLPALPDLPALPNSPFFPFRDK